MHLCGNRRRRLRSRGQNECQAQSNPYDRSLKFFHAFCRSPHSGQSLILFPRVAVLRTEGHIWERSMSSHNAAASCQSTSPRRSPSRNPAFSGANPPRSGASLHSPWSLPCRSITRPGQRLRPPWASANSGDASSAHAGWPLHSSTSHEKTGICSRTFPGCSSFPRHVTRTTGPRERHAGACQARFPELRRRANSAGEKASFAGSPADR